MIKITNKESGKFIGNINEKQLQFLIDQLEKESTEDKDYYITQATIDMLENKGIDQELLKLLKNELGSQEDIEIVWECSE